MGIQLFGIDISGIIASAMAPGLPVITLVKKKSGTRTDGSLTAGTNPKSARSEARGFTDDYKDSQIDGTVIKRGDRKVLIIGDTLPDDVVPEPGDELIAEGQTWKICEGGVKRDPAAATYECHSRLR